MSNIVSRNVDDLPVASRQGIEELLGTELQPHERVYIVVDVPPSGPVASVRIPAAQRIRELLATAQANAEALNVSDAQADAAIEEAMSHIRPRN
jgi:hypothetical protein